MNVIWLVIISAILHSYWNATLKKAINEKGDSVLIYWLSILLGLLIYASPFILLLFKYGISTRGIALSTLAGLFLAIYTYFISKAYQNAELSHVYPLAKITPLFTLLIGVAYLHEKLNLASFIGITLVILGVYTLNLQSVKSLLAPIISLKEPVSRYALLSALISSIYGLFSKLGVRQTHPLLFVYLAFFFSAVFYTPIVLAKLPQIEHQLYTYKNYLIQIAFADLFGYSLILIALSISTLSSVFALRQLSIVFSVLIGIFFFKEHNATMRVISSLIILSGITLITLS